MWKSLSRSLYFYFNLYSSTRRRFTRNFQMGKRNVEIFVEKSLLLFQPVQFNPKALYKKFSDGEKECGNLCREVFTFISTCTVQPEGALQEIFRWGKGMWKSLSRSLYFYFNLYSSTRRRFT